jgi:hypothetical protein
VTGRRHGLRDVVPAGPKADSEAEKVMRRLAGQVDERRNPRTSATVDQLLDRHLETLDVGRTEQRMYTKYLEKHVRPFLGRLKAGAVDADALDSLYDTKSHQQRRLALAPATVEVPSEHRERCREQAAALGLELPPDAFVFSNDPDGRTHLLPSSVPQRYGRLAKRLGIDTNTSPRRRSPSA